ncbi:hypothetical protein [uncultured Amnibacterium sp.]
MVATSVALGWSDVQALDGMRAAGARYGRASAIGALPATSGA